MDRNIFENNNYELDKTIKSTKEQNNTFNPEGNINNNINYNNENRKKENRFVDKKVTRERNLRVDNAGIVLIISILLSLVCGMIGSYIICKTVSVDQVVKNITTSELVENSISSSVDKVYSSTVAVITSSKGKQISTGTGFIYKVKNGKAYIMTNNHVIEGGDSISIEFNDSSDRIKATKVGGDKYADIAVLTINDNNYKIVETGDSSNLKLGDTIFTVGSPMGIEYKGTVTKGILSGRERMVEVNVSGSQSDYFMKVDQIDAAVNPGNSGGPLCDVSGKVIGIISLKIVQDEVEGMGFAIPIKDALKYAEILENGGEITRPFIGISMLDLTEEYYLWQNKISVPSGLESGIAIVSVDNNTPAARAGLRKGDIITHINETQTNTLSEFRYELYKHEVGEKIKVTFYRNSKKMETEITLGKSNN